MWERGVSDHECVYVGERGCDQIMWLFTEPCKGDALDSISLGDASPRNHPVYGD